VSKATEKKANVLEPPQKFIMPVKSVAHD
jgi:hypothetical protein